MAREPQQLLGVGHRDVFEYHGREERRHLRLLQTGRRVVVIAPLHVGAVAPVLGEDGEPVELADRILHLRGVEQLKSLLDGEFVWW